MVPKSVDILAFIERETGYQFPKEKGNEVAGPCPFCQAGDARFVIWPKQGRYWCRICDHKGDVSRCARDYQQISDLEACQYTGQPSHSKAHRPAPTISVPLPPQRPPGPSWQDPACDFVMDCANRLLGSGGEKSLAWLH